MYWLRSGIKGAVALTLSANCLLPNYWHLPTVSQQKEFQSSSWGQRWDWAREEKGQKEAEEATVHAGRPLWVDKGSLSPRLAEVSLNTSSYRLVIY